MKKYILDLIVSTNEKLHNNYILLKLTSPQKLPEMLPGQFAEIRVDKSPSTFLRRPISINYIDKQKNELWLLVQKVGDGTRALADVQPGEIVNIVAPLGNTFSTPQQTDKKLLLVGGGVGTAPMLFLGSHLKEMGFSPNFLLGARSANDVLQLDDFRRFGNVYITTEDGSLGEKGYVTQHSILENETFDCIYTCGPKPMMVAVAAYAKKRNIQACLCCVEKTTEGHVCVCKDGPVFNIEKLTWQI